MCDFLGLPVVYQVFYGIASAAAVLVLGVYIEEVAYFFRRLYNWKPRDKAKWILAVYPVFNIGIHY